MQDAIENGDENLKKNINVNLTFKGKAAGSCSLQVIFTIFTND